MIFLNTQKQLNEMLKADMLEVYRNLGALTKRIAELENLINKETTTLKKR